MKTILLANGLAAIVDDQDFPLVSQHRWFVKKGWNTHYAVTRLKTLEGKYRDVMMHRLILNPPADMVVDHRNYDGLDNRRENIWICTQADNAKNICKNRAPLTVAQILGI